MTSLTKLFCGSALPATLNHPSPASPDAGVAPTALVMGDANGTENRTGILLTASLVSSLIVLDSNIVAVSLPAMGRALGASFVDVQWIISAYVLTYAALLMATGNWADVHGRRRAMIIGLTIFAVASAICGTAPTSLILNLARAGQGVGGAMLLTSSLAVIGHDFTGSARNRAFAFWGASLGIALAIGPIVGGAITKYLGWRWIFLINIPICLALIAMTFQLIVESKDPTAHGLDGRGIVTFSGGLALLIWAMIDGNDAGWDSWSILLRLVSAAILLLAFVAVEWGQTHAMVDLALFRRRTFVGAVLAMIGYGASAQVMVFFLPQFLQNAYGFAPLTAGLAMMPFALPMGLAPRYINKLATKVSGRAILTIGLAASMSGNIAFWLIARAGLSYPTFTVSMLIAGIGVGILNGQTVKILGGSVPPDRSGMASGLASTTRFIGILIAVAGLGAVLSAVTRQAFQAQSHALGLSARATDAAARKVAAGDIPGMLSTIAPPARELASGIAHHAFAQGFATITAISAFSAAASAILAFGIIRSEDTAPIPVVGPMPCKAVDCRDPM
jgi:EmrB/QacA subfamily drug resistance transporter